MADDKKSLHQGYVHYIPAVEERDDWDKDLTFVLIRSLDELRVHDVEHDYTAWDTETSGLDPDMDYLVGFSFSFDGKTGYYVPVAHDDMALGTEAVEIFYSILKKTRKSQFLFNCRFDQRFLEFALKHKGWTLDGMPYYDVQNAIWLADTNVVMPSLKASERHFLGWKPKTFDETLGDAVTFQHVPAEDAYRYACTDAVSTYQLALVSNKFYHENLPASRFDNAMLYPLMRLENTPQRLDTEYLKSMLPQVEATIERTREEVYRLAGTQFNLNAPKQFGKVLVERFGVDTGARTATGAMKADLKTIDAWMVKHNATIGQDIKDFINTYKEYKKTVKFKSSYLDKYIKTASEQDVYPIRFSYKTNSVPCLTENNTVLVKDRGFISIKDVNQNDMIWTAWGYRRVLWNKYHDVDKVYRVTLRNGMTIEGTDRHPVLVRKSPLESVNPRGMTKDDVEWAGLCDLKNGEPVIINHTCAASSCDNGKLCILARIMGYFYGKGRNIDGCLFTLRFVRGKTSSYYRELLVSLFGEKGVSRYDVDSKCVEYNVTRHVLSQLLEQFDLIPEIQTDSHGNKKVDNVSVYVRVAHARSILHDTFRHFLCGYLDSKGTSLAAYNVKDIPENWVDGIHKDRVVFVIPSKERDLIVPMLWAESIGCDVTEHSFQAWFGECKITRIDIHEPYALSNLKGLWSDFDPLTERFSSIRFPKQMRLYLESEVANVEVVDGEIKVYDIEVEDVHEYVANGIVTHNTGRLSCFSSDALVHTRQGLVRIADITEEHDVEIAKDVYSKASLIRTGEQEFLRFALSSGKSIECTSDHRFLCPSDTGYVWRFASEIQCGDSLCRTAVSFKGLQINFEMFLYGFFLGDGSYYVGHSGKIQRRRKESLRLFFNTGDYDAMMYIHNNLVERGVRHSMREIKDTLYVIEMSATACRIVSKWFPVANVPQKEREVDFSVIHSKVDAFSVLCGFYQAEGEKHIRKSDGKMDSSLNITSYSLVCSLQKLADYVGIRTKIHRLKIDTEKHPTYSQQWRLQFCVKSFRKYLDDSIPFRINTKKSVPTFLTTALNSLAKDIWKVGERNKFKAMFHNKRYSLYSVMRLCEDSCLPVEVFDYEEVISIESCGKKEAYTLTVDHPLHRYIAEGVINHNCGTSAKNKFFTNNNVQCLEEHTQVLTDNGLVEIKDIHTGDLVWTGSRFVPCVQLGAKTKKCEKVWTRFGNKDHRGSIVASLEHQFLCLNSTTFELEFHRFADCLSHQYALVRNVADGGFTFEELLADVLYRKQHILETHLVEDAPMRYASLCELYKDVRFDVVDKTDTFWFPYMDVPEVTVYDLCVPTYERFTANGFIVHNSTPKPHAVMLKGRKATEQEIAEKKDILGWYFSNDIPDDDAKGLVEGMDPDHFNIRRAFLPENDQCYVVSIDMCLEGGSPVQTKRGYIGICDMKPGDEVWSPQGWVKVERIMRTGVEKVIKVFPDNGGQAIYCTENHPFVIDGKKVKAKDIVGKVPSVPFPSYVKEIYDRTKMIDKLSCLYCCTTLKEASVIVREQGLKPVIEEALEKYTRAEVAKWCGIRVSSFGHFMNDLGIQPTGKAFRYSQSKFYNNVFAGESTPTSAYLFGFILGDGNISRRRGDYLTLNISSKDEAHLRQICNIFGADLNIRHNEKKGCEWWCLDIPSREICNRLLSLGIAERKSTEPSNIDFEWLGENFRHFIRGVFDSDGYVRITSVLDVSFVGHDSYMKEISKRIEGQWSYKSTPSLSYLSLLGTVEQRKFIYEYLYKEATIWLQRKRDVFDSWYEDKFGDLVFPVWNCTVETSEHQLYVQCMNVHQCAEELRIVANLYHEDTWIKAFNSGADVHKACYSPDTEFYVKSQGWMYAENITPEMEIAYYDVSSDSFKFTTAGKRAKHKGQEVYVRSGVFNVTGNHRMYVDFDARGYHIERADNLKNCGNAKQRFHMKTAVGTRIEFLKERNDDNATAFALGFLSSVDKEFDGTRMIVKCSRVYPEVFQILKDDAGSSTHKTWFTFSAQGVSRLILLGFSTSLGRIVDDAQIFSSHNRYRGFLCGLLHGLSCRKDSEMYLGDGTNVHGRAYVKDKKLADWIQWHLTCNGYSCRIQHNVRSNRYALHIESRPNKDVGMTFHSVTGHSLTEGGIYSCFEVPSGLLVTRYDGRITVNGNTAIKLFGEENYTKDARKKAKCLSGDMTVFTNHGIFSLTDLYKAFSQRAFVSDLQIATPSGMKLCSNVVCNGVKSVLKVLLTSGETLSATSDHLVLTSRGWVELGSLNIGDSILSDVCISEVCEDVFLPLSFIKGSFLKVTPELTYLLGAVLGDGTVSKKQVYYFSEDQELLDYVESILHVFGLPYVHRHVMRISKVSKKPFVRISCGARIGRRLFSDAGLVTERGRKLLKVPDLVKKSNISCRFAFIQGLFDTDGTVTKFGSSTSCSIAFCTAVKEFALEVAQLCRSVGLWCRVSSDFNKVYKRYYYKVRVRASSAPRFAELGGFRCFHKQERLVEWLNKGYCRKSYAKHYKIVSIETSEDVVYDLTIDDDKHAFLSNGVIVHNCASFGILYGSGAQGFNQSFPDMTLDECRDFMKKFKDALPAISQGQAENVAYARQYGDINTGFGRHRRVKFWLSSQDRAKQAFGERTVKNCYSPDTEYMTKDGWKVAADIEPTTQLAYYDPDTGVIRYCDAGIRYTHVCTESMKFSSRTADWDVTTNHRMWIRSTSHDRWRPCEAGNLENLTVWQEICSADLCSSLVETSDLQTPLGTFSRMHLARLFAWVLTDSTITEKEHYIVCTQNKPQNFSVIEEIFSKFGAKVTIRNCVQASSGKEMRAYLAKPEFCEWVLEQIGGRLKQERHVPAWVFNSSKEVREEFLRHLVLADGTTSKDSKRQGCTFYSANKSIVDDVQILFTMTGFRASLQTYHNANGTEVYRLNCVKTSVRSMDNRIRKSGNKQLTRVKHEPIEYSCFSVPTQILVTRHHGKVTFGMNTSVQGTAADVLKIIFCRLWELVFKPYPQVKFMSTIHDEVNFSIPIELAREVIPICIRCMTIEREDWPVTLKCSLSISRTDLGSLIPFTYDAETNSYEPEWDTLEVKSKATQKQEIKDAVSDEADDGVICGVSLDEIDF